MRNPLKYIFAMVILLLGFIIALSFLRGEWEVPKIGRYNCPLTNNTYSLCFVKNEECHYFSVLGWISPNATILEKYIKLLGSKYGSVRWRGGFSNYGEGIILFLAVKTNLDWRWLMSTGEVLVGNLYKECLLGCIDCSIQVNDDTFLIPYVLEVFNSWESYKIVTDYYLSSNTVRLYFEPRNFLDLREDQVIKIGKIVVMLNRYDKSALVMYIEYPLSKFSLSIVDIKYFGKDNDYYIFNATFKIDNAGIIVYYSFNEFGQKYMLSEVFIPMYLLTIEGSLTNDIWMVGRVNETHYLVATPTASGHIFAIRYYFGSGFKDAWLEPQHEYIASYAATGDVFWLKIEVWHEHVVNNTLIFLTPWREYEVKISKPNG